MPEIGVDLVASDCGGRRLPIPAFLAGYSALIQRFDLPVPLHHTMAAVAPRNLYIREGGWTIYPAPRRPGPVAA